ISSTVGLLYDKNDARMDSAFTILYMSINLGALLSPLIIGWVQFTVSFHFGFAIAAVWIFFVLLAYILTNKKSLVLAGFVGLYPFTHNKT
ncbi:POT-type proton-dependent oligopeptide transporter, partial [Staphylococcus pseudintermedius]|uniref:POT-type proton-dependent oligopeptide transporter n=1 Tax=Staphylococcus pseudintermedius TaxID=283734 RepID=UPI003F6DD043